MIKMYNNIVNHLSIGRQYEAFQSPVSSDTYQLKLEA